MAKKKWIVVVDWIDGVVTDSDEVAVYAETSDAAIAKAKATWRTTVGMQHPSCRIESAWVLTKERERFYCS